MVERVERSLSNKPERLLLDDWELESISPIVAGKKAVITELAGRSRDLFDRVRAGKAKREELLGSTFTISNLGPYGVEHFTAIINPPEAAILAVGGTKPEAVVEDGEMVVRRICRLTLSSDHRLIDGVAAAGFLGSIKQFLEKPERLFR